MVGKLDQISMNVNRNQGKESYIGKKCEFCNLTGHTKEYCNKLIRYPVDWKQRKKDGTFRNMHSHNTSSSGVGHIYGNNRGGIRYKFVANNISSGLCDHTHEASTINQLTNHEGNDIVFPKGQTFTEEKYKQILTLLYKDATESKQVNMTGTTTCLMSYTGFTQN